MSNVRLSWTLPTPTPAQRPIAHVAVSARVDEALPWTEIAVVAGTELLIQDVAPGTWFYRAIVVDDEGRESEPAFVSASVSFDAPGSVIGFAASVE